MRQHRRSIIDDAVERLRRASDPQVHESSLMRRIRMNDVPVVILECKGDDALLQTFKRAVAAHGTCSPAPERGTMRSTMICR